MLLPAVNCMLLHPGYTALCYGTVLFHDVKLQADFDTAALMESVSFCVYDLYLVCETLVVELHDTISCARCCRFVC